MGKACVYIHEWNHCHSKQSSALDPISQNLTPPDPFKGGRDTFWHDDFNWKQIVQTSALVLSSSNILHTWQHVAIFEPYSLRSLGMTECSLAITYIYISKYLYFLHCIRTRKAHNNTRFEQVHSLRFNFRFKIKQSNKYTTKI